MFMSAPALPPKWAGTLIEGNRRETVGGLENMSGVQLSISFLHSLETDRIGCSHVSKCQSCFVLWFGDLLHEWDAFEPRNKGGRENCAKYYCFLLVRALFRWLCDAHLILHFAGVITVTIHSFSDTSYLFCDLKLNCWFSESHITGMADVVISFRAYLKDALVDFVTDEHSLDGADETAVNMEDDARGSYCVTCFFWLLCMYYVFFFFALSPSWFLIPWFRCNLRPKDLFSLLLLLWKERVIVLAFSKVKKKKKTGGCLKRV